MDSWMSVGDPAEQQQQQQTERVQLFILSS